MNKLLKEAVIHEVNMIRKHATNEEIQKLDFKSLEPTNMHFCIYGQMTGNCYSQRASELINKCSNKYVYVSIAAGEGRIYLKYERDIDTDFTALERCIFEYPNYNPRIIEALKGNLKPELIFEHENN